MILKGIFLFALALPVYSGSHKDLTDYCNDSVFNPNCGENGVIVMTHASYGMIRVGKCLHSLFSSVVGCVLDSLQHFDQMCSGKQKCEVAIPVMELNFKLSCLESGFSPYLEASYTCQTVYSTSRKCTQPARVEAKTNGVVLSSKASLDTSCGQQNTPYVIEAKAGQTVDISLTDFSWTNNTETCVTYGYILDTQSDDVINICGHAERENHVYSSAGNTVQIMLENNALQDNQFLIRITASGCPDLEAPEYGWVKKEQNTLKIGCYATADMWQLQCVDNVWLGHSGTCDPATETKTEVLFSPITSVVPKRGASESEEMKPVSITRNHVLIVTIGCVTLILCCVVIIVGIYCTRRYQRKSLRECGMSHQPDDYSYRGNQETLMMLPTYNMSLNGTQTLNQTSMAVNTQNCFNNGLM